MGGRGRGARPRAGRRHPRRRRDRPRRGLRRHQGAAARADAGGLRGLRRHRIGEQGPRQRHLRDLRRRRQGAGAAGLLPDRAHLPDLRRPGPGDPQPLPDLPRRRHGAARAQPAGADPGRRRGRHAHPPGRRGRGRRPGRAAGRSVCACRHPAAPDLPARRRQHLLPRAAAHDPGGAGRRGRGAGDRRQQGAGENPAGHPDRRSVPPARQGLFRAAQRRARRHVSSRSRWKRRST